MAEGMTPPRDVRPKKGWLFLTRKRGALAHLPLTLLTHTLRKALQILRRGGWKGVLVDGAFWDNEVTAWEAAYVIRERHPELMVAVLEEEAYAAPHH